MTRRSSLLKTVLGALFALALAFAFPALADEAAGGDPANAESAAPIAEVADPEAALAEPALAHDLSAMGMFMAADWVVKAVMLGLLFASVITWTVWLVKTLQLRRARRQSRQATAELAKATSLHQALVALAACRGTVTDFGRAARRELQLSADGALTKDGVKERVQSRLQDIEAASGRAMSQGTGLLATIGSTAPFVGLFGTVWGIMNSFIGIAQANTTNLAVVAPGIAEALLATALGLLAAIPAVIIYNHFARGIGSWRAELNAAGSEMLRLISRDLDRGDMASIEEDATAEAA
ncbi:MAG: tonB-system energizer ExbB [Pseudomonadota bacterium]